MKLIFIALLVLFPYQSLTADERLMERKKFVEKLYSNPNFPFPQKTVEEVLLGIERIKKVKRTEHAENGNIEYGLESEKMAIIFRFLPKSNAASPVVIKETRYFKEHIPLYEISMICEGSHDACSALDEDNKSKLLDYYMKFE